jgi:methyl-accepting chemotaxis protein
MRREWTFGKRVGLGFGLSGLILLLIALVGYLSTDRLIANNRLVKHSYDVRRILAELPNFLTDAETGQRGYTITGVEEYLEPYRAALPEIPKAMDELRRMTADNPDQQRRLDSLQPLLDARIAQLRDNVEVRQKSGFEAAQKLIAKGDGRETMEQIRVIIGQMDAEEGRLLDDRQAAAEEAARMAKTSIAIGSLIGALAVGLVAWATITALTNQIGSAVQKVQSSSAELQAVANQQASSAKEQSSAMSEIAATLSELLATSRQIAESAVRVSRIADQASGAARSGDVTVEKSREAMGSIQRQVESIVAHMLELGKKSQHIGAVVDIVSELAEQTNILAINATIEAAGAGEAGKRFAVVADEIRKLAERVTGSTKEIRSLIDDVRGAVNTTVMATETGSKSVEAGSRHFGEATEAFKQIAGVALTTTDAAREIELSTKQQATAVEQVNIAISNLTQSTRETEASSGQTFQTASQLAVLSEDLLRIVRPDAAA